jgi:S1-C subfamily serine protease
LLVTNAHVVAEGQSIKVSTRTGDAFLASIVATDSVSDLALLRIKGWSGPHLEFANENEYDVGHDVIAVGSPLGLDGTVTRGIISAKRSADGVKLLQIDAAINPGNSGGPLVDERGRVVGVNAWKIRNERAESLGFAVSVETVLKFVAPFRQR